MAAVFSSDAYFADVFGNVELGRASIASLLGAQHRTFLKNSILKVRLDHAMDLVDLKIKIVLEEWDVDLINMSGKDGSPLAPLSMRVSVVWRYDDQLKGWYVQVATCAAPYAIAGYHAPPSLSR